MSELKDRVRAATTAEAPAEDQVREARDSEQPVTDLARNDSVVQWLDQRAGYFETALPRHIDAAHFMSVARGVMPNLRKCSNDSILTALLACARFGLEPDGRQAAIIPYGDTATFQPMYQGYIELMYRHSRVDSVHFNWVRQNDAWDYEPTAPSPRDFYHKPRVDLTEEERGPVILAYAFAWINGQRSQVIILNKADAIAIRDTYSGAFKKAEKNGRRDSSWHTDFDAMWAKSAVRRLVKVVPTSTELTELLTADDDADDTGATVPPVIRGTVITRDQQPDNAEQADAWPETAQPGSSARPGDEHLDGA